MKSFNIKNKSKLVSGFTLIEMLVAVFVLTIALSALLSLISSTLFSARYANNEIIANYLMQEAADYIRNDRDTTVVQPTNSNSNLWNDFLNHYGNYNNQEMCFSSSGCQFDVNPFDLRICDGEGYTFGASECSTLRYDAQASLGKYYTYDDSVGEIRSNFKRQIKMSVTDGDSNILNVTVTVEWLNGTVVKSRSMNFSLTNWQPAS